MRLPLAVDRLSFPMLNRLLPVWGWKCHYYGQGSLYECTEMISDQASSSSLIHYLKGSTDPEGKISPEVNVTGMKQMSRNIQNIYIFGHVHLGMFI